MRIGQALILSHLCAAVIIFYAKAQFVSRGVILFLLPLNFVLIMISRLGIVRLIFGSARPRTVVLGTGKDAATLARTLSLLHGHEIVGLVGAGNTEAAGDCSVLGPPAEIARILAENTPVDIVAIPSDANKDDVALIYASCRDRGTEVLRLIDPLDNLDRTVSIEIVGGRYALVEAQFHASGAALLVKRLMDIAGAVVGLLIIAPLFPLIAFVIKITSRGPVFFRHPRRGQNGRVFNMLKFRTMVDGAHEMRDDIKHLNEADGPHFKIANDPRLTSVGRLLRRTSLDEFPQFWSVLRGDMSLVGPRPFPVEEVVNSDLNHCRRLGMKPGITGIWQTSGRSEIKNFDAIRRMDEDYMRRWSIWLDIWILLKTIPAIVSGRGAQ
jgi:exopolysaccharide biosynthesis polyprenyl glycosylphosphotransferase